MDFSVWLGLCLIICSCARVFFPFGVWVCVCECSPDQIRFIQRRQTKNVHENIGQTNSGSKINVLVKRPARNYNGRLSLPVISFASFYIFHHFPLVFPFHFLSCSLFRKCCVLISAELSGGIHYTHIRKCIRLSLRKLFILICSIGWWFLPFIRSSSYLLALPASPSTHTSLAHVPELQISPQFC